jgi:hypothetical protein
MHALKSCNHAWLVDHGKNELKYCKLQVRWLKNSLVDQVDHTAERSFANSNKASDSFAQAVTLHSDSSISQLNCAAEGAADR